LKITVEIPTGNESPSENLFTVSMREFQESINTNGSSIQFQIGLLRMLTVWIYDCPKAVRQLVESTQYILFLFKICYHTSPHISGLCSLLLGICALDNTIGFKDILFKNVPYVSMMSFLDKVIQSDDFTNVNEKMFQDGENSQRIPLYDITYTYFFQVAYAQIKAMNPVISINPNSNETEKDRYYDGLQGENEKLKKENEALLKKLAKNSEKRKKIEERLHSENQTIINLNNRILELSTIKEQHDELNKVHQDLLVVLGMSDNKRKHYKRLCKESNLKVSDSSEEEQDNGSDDNSVEEN